MAETDFLKEKIRTLQREKDQLQLQLSKAARGVSFPGSQAPAAAAAAAAELESLRQDLARQSAELAGKTALVGSLQTSLHAVELENHRIKEDAAIASLSMELDAGPEQSWFEDKLGRLVRSEIIHFAPHELRTYLLFNEPQNLANLKKFVDDRKFLPRFIRLLPFINPSAVEIARGLLPDLRFTENHLDAIRALVETDAISDQEQLWSVLTRAAETLKKSTLTSRAPVFRLATAAVKRLDLGQVKRLQKELSESLVLRASHAVEAESAAVEFLSVLARRSPDILGLASLRCNSLCLNVAQRLLHHGINGVYALDPMPVSRARMVIKILARIAAVRSERGGKELQATLSNAADAGKTSSQFRPPPIFGHLMEFLPALVEAMKLRPLYAAEISTRSDLKILAAFYADFNK